MPLMGAASSCWPTGRSLFQVATTQWRRPSPATSRVESRGSVKSRHGFAPSPGSPYADGPVAERSNLRSARHLLPPSPH